MEKYDDECFFYYKHMKGRKEMKGISRISKQLLAMVLSLAMVGGSLATPVDVRGGGKHPAYGRYR